MMNHPLFQKIPIFALSFLLIFSVGFFPIILGNNQNEQNIHHQWKLHTKESFIMNNIIIGNLVIEQMITDIDCWDHDNFPDLCDMFAGCNKPKDFYDIVQNSTIDAWANTKTQTLHLIDTNLSSLIKTVNTENNSLCCAQQTLLVLYGVMALFSCYDSQLNQIFLEPSHSDFKMEIWRSFDFCFPVFPWRSHYQLIVDIWDGNDYFVINNKTVDKLEIDPWENEFREWNVFNESICYHCLLPKLNTIIYTTGTISS